MNPYLKGLQGAHGPGITPGSLPFYEKCGWNLKLMQSFANGLC